jgi:thiamine-phosphate pyrophosphorylase
LQRLRQLTTRPLVAIGGITRENATGVWHAGADSVAVIGDLLAGSASYPALRARTAEWLKLSENAHGA